jgi:putative peptidoglycan lipid II flippase
MTRIILPAQVCFFCGGILMAVQFAKERFLIPALAPLIYNGGIIIGGVVLYPTLGMEGFCWGVLGGAFVGNFILQWLGARSVGMKWYPVVSPSHTEFKKYILLTLPLMVGMTMTFSIEIIPKFFGSFLSSGSIASLNYGIRIMFLLVGLLGQAVGTASYPYLSKLAVENNMLELNRLLNTTLKRISLVIPCSVLVIVLRKEIVFLLFERGKFNESSTVITSEILIYLMIGAFAFTAQTIVNRGFYAVQNTIFPTVCVTVILVLTLPLYYLGMIHFEIYGVALALSASTILQVTLLFAFWNKKSGNDEGKAVYLFYLKMIMISVPLSMILLGTKYWALAAIEATTTMGSFFHLVVLAFVFLLTVLVAGYLFRIKEISDISDFFIVRLKNGWERTIG